MTNNKDFSNKAKEPAVAYAPSAPPTGIRIKQGNHTLKKVSFDDNKQHFFKKQGLRSLRYQELKSFIDYLEFGQLDLAQFLDVNASTVSRWKSQNSDLGSLRSKNILEVDQIIAKGVRIFTTEENFKNWLKAPNNALGDQKPLDLLANPFGIASVDNALEALSWGTYL